MPKVKNEHALKVAAEIVAERDRQQAVEGWTPEHDDAHADGELAEAATCYAASSIAWIANRIPSDPLWNWPWSRAWWKPKDARRDLIRAAALIVAEIERLDRAALRGEVKP